MKLKYLLVVLGIVAAVAVVFWFAADENSPETTLPSEKSNQWIADGHSKPSRVHAKVSAEVIREKRAKKRNRVRMIDEYSPADRKLADAVQFALDAEDFEQTRAAAENAMKSENPEVRQEAVDALGWFGDKALVDLTKAMSDKNSDVAESARGHVEDALMGMEDDDRAVALANEYVKLFAEDDNAVTMFVGVMSSAGSRIIDPDDADSVEDVANAKAHRSGIVDIVEEMIGKGGKLAEKGRELYSDITGEEWSDRVAAEQWANDIDEPESDSENENS